MISIPLPPRPVYLSPAKRVLKKFREIATINRDTLAESGAENHIHHRRKTMRRAFAYSVVINVLVFLILYLIVLETREDGGGDGGMITVIKSVDDKEKSASNSAAVSSGQEMKPASSPPIQPKELNLIAVVTGVPKIEMSSLELSTYDVAVDSGLSTFSPSMTSKDRRRKTVRGSDPFAKNDKPSGKGTGSADVFGAMPNDVNGFFEGKTVGDGSDLILFLDVSGSMKERSEAVGRYVEINFPKASIIEVKGCNFRGQNPALYQPMLTSKEMKTRSQLVFVCDLQDGVDPEGVGQIAKIILWGNKRKSFNVISFNKSPHELVLGLIERSNGSFKRAN